MSLISLLVIGVKGAEAREATTMDWNAYTISKEIKIPQEKIHIMQSREKNAGSSCTVPGPACFP